MKFRFKDLTAKEARTFKLHTLYNSIEGVILGVIALNEFVFLKSLHGSNYQMSFLFQFSVIVFVFLIFFNEYLQRVKNRKKFLRIVGIFTRAPLLILLFFPQNEQAISGNSVYHYVFLFVFFVYYFGNITIYPTINFFLKSNYRLHNFGKLYSYSTTVNKIVLLFSTFVYGLILDANNYNFVYVLPVISVLGMISVFILSKIEYPDENIVLPKLSLIKSVRNSAGTMLNILKKNVGYRHFEIGFMFYGFAFMTTYTVVNIYFYEALDLNYSSVAFYRNAYNILAILILPFAGRILGKIDPRKFAVITFSSLMLYVFFLMMTQYFPYFTEIYNIQLYYTLIFYILFHGVFAATMVLLWNIGSAYFCKPSEAGTYQSIHLSLTGVRSIFAPLLGVLFYELFGFTFTFGLAMFVVFLGILLMIWSYKTDKKTNQQSS